MQVRDETLPARPHIPGAKGLTRKERFAILVFVEIVYARSASKGAILLIRRGGGFFGWRHRQRK